MILPTPRLQREFRTLGHMVDIYCRDHRHARTPESTCTECQDLLAYAGRRLEKCPYGDHKPTCARCPIHCYKPAKREIARIVMRYAGPRMALRHPWLSLQHVLDKLRDVEHPMEARRRQRDRPIAAPPGGRFATAPTARDREGTVPPSGMGRTGDANELGSHRR